jgi:hypothetical protein
MERNPRRCNGLLGMLSASSERGRSSGIVGAQPRLVRVVTGKPLRAAGWTVFPPATR